MEILAVRIILLLVLLAFSAFFSGSEAALFSLPRARVSTMRRGSMPGRVAASLLSSPRDLLVTILLGNLFVNIFATSMVTSIAVRVLGEKGVGYAFLGMSALILFIGEIVPKVLALHSAESFSKGVSLPLKMFHTLFRPVCIPLSSLADAVIRALRGRLGHFPKVLSPGELRTAVRMGMAEGDLDDFAYIVLSNILSFREKVVREIMTPSIEVFSLPADLEPGELTERIRKSPYSRIPVYRETPDDIKGVVHVKDLARMEKRGTPEELDGLLRQPFYVPENLGIAELFRELTKRRAHIAFVIDEYGSFVGLVTMEDILEEIVGEIRDSKEPSMPEYQVIDENSIVIPGTMEIERFNDVFGTKLSDPRFETMAGYLIGITGTIPREGETISAGGLKFHVVSADPNRIRKMRVERGPSK